MKRIVAGFAVSVFVLASCSDEPELNNKLLLTHTPLVQEIFYTDDSLLHGISLGMKKDEVKKLLAPGDSITLEESDYLMVEGKFGEPKNYLWECEFDADGLSALSLEIFLKDEETATDWYTDITAYFTDKYGPATDDGMALTWEIRNAKRPARIELAEEMGYGYGKLNIHYYDLSYIPALDESDSIQTSDSFFLPSDNIQ